MQRPKEKEPDLETEVGSTDKRGAGPRVGWFLSWRKACSFPTCWAREASYWGGRGCGEVSLQQLPPPLQKRKEKNNLVSASETPRGVSRGRSSLVSELRLQRTLNCTGSLVRPLDLWTVAGEIVCRGSSYLRRGPGSLGGIWRSAPGLGLGRTMARPPQFPLAIARRSRASIGYLST